jgi:nucleoside diphosphate kinase
MSEQLAYALITPYSLRKSRTGGIIGRLVSQTKLELVDVRMYAPSDKFVDEYLKIVEKSKIKKPFKEGFYRYVDENFRRKGALEKGFTNRFMMLLFKGSNALKELRRVVGSPSTFHLGYTVRGTYGDFVIKDGSIEYFEPAVIMASDKKHNDDTLKLLSKYAEKDGGVIDKIVPYPKGTKVETTLVMLKPDNFVKRSSRPGNIIDMFANTGLTIVGSKFFSMSVKQGLEFYGFLENLFAKKLKFIVADTIKENLTPAFDFEITDKEADVMSDIIKKKNAHCEVGKIIEYMTGYDPDTVPKNLIDKPGKNKCLALLYQGEDAIEKIRTILGATDPTKAEGGTIRSDYGRDLMVNGVHASDSVKSAERERPIIGLKGGEKCNIKTIINNYLKSSK